MPRAALLALAPALLAGCGPAEPRPDIVLISIDTLRADHLGLYGYARPTSPNLDRWFGDALVFEDAYATETATSPSVASLLTGLVPQHHRVRLFYQLLPGDVRTLAERLRDGGYQSAAVVSNVVLTDEAMGMAGRFDHYDDFIEDLEPTRRTWERKAGDTTDAALAWLRGGRDPARPLFLWVHYIDPHGPYRPPEDRPIDFTHEGREPVPDGRMLSYMMVAGAEDALEYVDLYDEEIAYCDREVGRLLDGLAPHVDAAQAAIVLTADHGETMAEHETWFTHQYDVYEGMARVPLALRLPSAQARAERVRGTVSLVDVAPTLLEIAGLGVPRELDGRSLLAERSGHALVEASGFQGRFQRRALVRGDDKWVVRLSCATGDVLERWRIRLDEDPGEERRLDWRPEDAEEAALLLQRVAQDPDPAGVPRAYERGRRIDAPKVRPDAGPEALEALRALGYAR